MVNVADNVWIGSGKKITNLDLDSQHFVELQILIMQIPFFAKTKHRLRVLDAYP
jgi:hypothetical protein